MFDKNKGWHEIILHLSLNNEEAGLAQEFEGFAFDANYIGDELDNIFAGFVWAKHEEGSTDIWEILTHFHTLISVKKILRALAGPMKQAFETHKTTPDEKH